jgi:hypothetical protein
VTSRKTAFFTVTAVKTSTLTYVSERTPYICTPLVSVTVLIEMFLRAWTDKNLIAFQRLSSSLVVTHSKGRVRGGGGMKI